MLLDDLKNEPTLAGKLKLAGQNAQIDPKYIYGIFGTESSFGKKTISPAGAEGPMQIMPANTKTYSQRTGVNLDPFNMDDALYMASEVLKESAKNPDVSQRLMAYNGGPSYNPNNPETKAYAGKVNYYSGFSTDPDTLQQQLRDAGTKGTAAYQAKKDALNQQVKDVTALLLNNKVTPIKYVSSSEQASQRNADINSNPETSVSNVLTNVQADQDKIRNDEIDQIRNTTSWSDQTLANLRQNVAPISNIFTASGLNVNNSNPISFSQQQDLIKKSLTPSQYNSLNYDDHNYLGTPINDNPDTLENLNARLDVVRTKKQDQTTIQYGSSPYTSAIAAGFITPQNYVGFGIGTKIVQGVAGLGTAVKVAEGAAEASSIAGEGVRTVLPTVLKGVATDAIGGGLGGVITENTNDALSYDRTVTLGSTLSAFANNAAMGVGLGSAIRATEGGLRYYKGRVKTPTENVNLNENVGTTETVNNADTNVKNPITGDEQIDTHFHNVDNNNVNITTPIAPEQTASDYLSEAIGKNYSYNKSGNKPSSSFTNDNLGEAQTRVNEELAQQKMDYITRAKQDLGSNATIRQINDRVNQYEEVDNAIGISRMSRPLNPDEAVVPGVFNDVNFNDIKNNINITPEQRASVLNDIKGQQERVVANTKIDYTKVANAKNTDNPIEADTNVLINSKSTASKAAGIALGDNLNGAVSRPVTMLANKSLIYQTIKSDIDNQFQLHFAKALTMEGKSDVTGLFKQNEITKFKDNFYKYRTNQFNGLAQPASNLNDIYSSLSREMDEFVGRNTQFLKKNNVSKGDSIPYRSEGYTPWQLNNDAYTSLNGLEQDAYVAKQAQILRNFVKDENFTDSIAQKVSKIIFDKKRSIANRNVRISGSPLSRSTVDTTEQYINNLADLAPEVKAKLVDSLRKGQSDYLKGLNKVNMNDVYYTDPITGVGKTLGDIAEKDYGILADGMAKRNAGEVALAQANIPSTQGLNLLRERMLNENAPANELSSFDRLSSNVLDSPYGSFDLKQYPNIRDYTLHEAELLKTKNPQDVANVLLNRQIGQLLAKNAMIDFQDIKQVIKDTLSGKKNDFATDYYKDYGINNIADGFLDKNITLTTNNFSKYLSLADHSILNNLTAGTLKDSADLIKAFTFSKQVEIKAVYDQVLKNTLRYIKEGKINAKGDFELAGDYAKKQGITLEQLNNMGMDQTFLKNYKNEIDKVAKFDKSGRVVEFEHRNGDVDLNNQFYHTTQRLVQNILTDTHPTSTTPFVNKQSMEFMNKVNEKTAENLKDVNLHKGEHGEETSLKGKAIFAMLAKFAAVGLVTHFTRTLSNSIFMDGDKRGAYLESRLSMEKLGEVAFTKSLGEGGHEIFGHSLGKLIGNDFLAHKFASTKTFERLSEAGVDSLESDDHPQGGGTKKEKSSDSLNVSDKNNPNIDVNGVSLNQVANQPTSRTRNSTVLKDTMIMPDILYTLNQIEKKRFKK